MSPASTPRRTGTAAAWGEEGHAIVAEIAQRRLSDASRTAVEQILGAIAPLSKEIATASVA